MLSMPSSMPPFALLWLGLLLGLRHAADPDHVVAVGAIAARTKRVWPAIQLGMAWGIGHTLTLFTVDGGIVFFRWVVPPRLGLAMELCVAIALVIVGLTNVRSHRHDRTAAPGTRGPKCAFLVGLVHGLAGSAAIALIVLATVDNPIWACAYLLVFGAGTLVGMTLITTGLAYPLASVAHRLTGGEGWVRVATGTVSLAMGVWLVYQIGWQDGLFLAGATWTPH